MRINFPLKWGLICVLLMALTLLSATRLKSSFPYSKPKDCTLEFWVGEDADTSDCLKISDSEYLAKGYKLAPGVDGRTEMPEKYVLYTIENQKVSGIEITDPSVEVWGLNVNSSLEEFDKTFKNMDYIISEVEGGSDTIHRAEKGRMSTTFCEGRWLTVDIKF